MQYTKFSGLTLALLCALPATAAEKPDLVLQITVDGLRADLIERYKHNFGEGGFRYLMDDGTYYTNANYQHGNTETIVGHVSLATGAPPSVHGMVGNVWCFYISYSFEVMLLFYFLYFLINFQA